MIVSIAYDNHVNIKFQSSDFIEFEMDMNRFKKAIDPKDRRYVSHKKTWVVTNVQKYVDVPFIQNALLDKQKQMELF